MPDWTPSLNPRGINLHLRLTVLYSRGLSHSPSTWTSLSATASDCRLSSGTLCLPSATEPLACLQDAPSTASNVPSSCIHCWMICYPQAPSAPDPIILPFSSFVLNLPILFPILTLLHIFHPAPCPQPFTLQHLTTLGIHSILILDPTYHCFSQPVLLPFHCLIASG